MSKSYIEELIDKKREIEPPSITQENKVLRWIKNLTRRKKNWYVKRTN